MNPNSTQVGGTNYTQQSIQPWDYMQSLMTPQEFEMYLVGNIIKYISRYRAKNGVQDLQKAQHYLEKLVAISLF